MYRARAPVMVLAVALWIFLPIAWILCLGQGVDQPDPQRMWALIIGVSRYTHVEPLRYAASDAQAFCDFLASPRGGAVPSDHIASLLEDRATRRSMEVELESMQGRVRPGDTVYIFIAGHGYITGRGLGYFIPSDGDMRVPASTSLSFASLKELVELGFASAQRRVLLTDLCHAGRIGTETADLAGKIHELVRAEWLKTPQNAQGSYLNLLSSHPLEKSWESDQLKRGVFSHTLLEALNGKAASPGSRIVRAGELVAYLRSEVPKYTSGRQTPMVNENFDARLPLSFLERKGPSPITVSGTESTPGETSSPTATLTLLNGDRTAYSRVQWLDPQTKAVTRRQIPWYTNRFEIDSLQAGELELIFFDASNKSLVLNIKLEAGQNTLNLLTLKLVPRAAFNGGRQQIASLIPTLPRLMPVSQPALMATASSAGNATLLVKLPVETRVYVDDSYFGESPGSDRFLQLEALVPGAHNLRLIPSPDREQRFRVKLFPGLQIFDVRTGELRAVLEVQPPPTFMLLPANLAPASEATFRKFHQALWEEKLIEPEGSSAWDCYQQLRDALQPPVRDSLKNRLIITMGDRAQRIILKYLRGGDIRWNAAVFEEGATLLRRTQALFKPSRALQAQQSFFDGRALLEKGRYPQAVQQLQEAIRLDAEASHALNSLALALWKQNLLQEAIDPLQRAIVISPEWTYPRITLGFIYVEQRRYQEAEETFEKAIQIDEEDSTAHHALGQLHLLLGRWPDAENQLKQAIELNPGNAYAYETWGKLLQRRQQWNEAEQMFRMAIRLEPEELSFHLSLAELLQKAGRRPEVQALFVPLMARDPDNPSMLRAYAELLAAQNNPREAEKIFRKAAKAAAGDANLLVNFGLFLQQQGRQEEAIQEFKAAVQAVPGSPYGHYNLAAAYLARKKIKEAEEELSAAMRADPRYPAAPFLLGRIRHAQGRDEEAIRELETALNLSIEPHQQQEIREVLKEVETTMVAKKIGEAKDRIDKRDYVTAWSIYAGILRSFPESRPLRDALLLFPPERFLEMDPAILPASPLTELLKTAFWKGLQQAELLWRQDQKGQALDAARAVLGHLEFSERPLALGSYYNLINEENGIHGKVFGWVTRLLEAQNYSGALELMNAAIQQNIFGIVPGVMPETIDSLMISPENSNPQKFADYEVAHHPDRRAHEIYAAAYASLGNLPEARRYLQVLEPAGPHLAVRLAVARILDGAKKWEDAITLLKECIASAEKDADRELRADVYVLLAEIYCRASDCPAGQTVLEEGARLIPESRQIQEARRKLKDRSVKKT